MSDIAKQKPSLRRLSDDDEPYCCKTLVFYLDRSFDLGLIKYVVIMYCHVVAFLVLSMIVCPCCLLAMTTPCCPFCQRFPFLIIFVSFVIRYPSLVKLSLSLHDLSFSLSK